MTTNLLPLAEVQKRTGRKRTSILTDKTFPKPVKVGGRNAWVEHEIEAWVQARIKERDACSV